LQTFANEMYAQQNQVQILLTVCSITQLQQLRPAQLDG
jgi:hypothetical protein